jgi:ABC-type cobalamin transport system permease subunit
LFGIRWMFVVMGVLGGGIGQIGLASPALLRLDCPEPRD